MRDELVQEIRCIKNCDDEGSRMSICVGCLVDYLMAYYQMDRKTISVDHKKNEIENMRKAILLIASSASQFISLDDFNKIVDLVKKD